MGLIGKNRTPDDTVLLDWVAQGSPEAADRYWKPKVTESKAELGSGCVNLTLTGDIICIYDSLTVTALQKIKSHCPPDTIVPSILHDKSHFSGANNDFSKSSI